MATLDLEPDAVGHYSEWSIGAGASKVAAVADGGSPDDDTTYLSVGQTDLRQSFYLANVDSGSIPDGSTIGSVALTIRGRCTNPSGVNTINHGVYDGTSEYETNIVTDLDDGPGNYADHTRTMTVDPVTGTDWAVATIRDWESGGATERSFGMISDRDNGAIRVTTISVTITYTESNPPPPSSASAGWGISLN